MHTGFEQTCVCGRFARWNICIGCGNGYLRCKCPTYDRGCEMVTRTHVSADEFAEFVAGPSLDSLPKRQTITNDPARAMALYNAVKASPSGTVGNGKEYFDTVDEKSQEIVKGEDMARKVGEAFRRLLNSALEAQEMTGESAKLSILTNQHRRDNGDTYNGYLFAVHIGPAREGKGTKRGPRKETTKEKATSGRK